ncbi:class I SAM-dependent methyltransferase [Nocardioides speluncae]|uniref:class I SAM-dependent methyltransferase n=1 Tax=Nocardioides speluncae TaxID=2670337 RepID=UPI000D687494|nr:class I SAM-dependent methyltransferase [Nocardioides speluncae]
MRTPSAADALAVENGLVRAGWELTDVVERLGAGAGERHFADRWRTERERGEAGYRPLRTGDLVSERDRAMYETPTNLSRFRRTLDFVLEGDRVLEVGIGRGYLGTRIMREAGAASYLGLDIVEENATATRQTLEVNGYAARATARVGDLYDLTRADVEGSDLLVCCEVIEHVPDPELALQVLAESLPDSTELLVTTPLLGRLETVWEHVAIFGVARLQQLMERAGLTVHHVEPVANQWVLILCSRGGGPSARAAQAVSRGAPDVRPVAPADRPTRVTNVDIRKIEPQASRWNKRLASVTTELVDAPPLGEEYAEEPADGWALAVRLEALPPDGLDDESGRYGGVAFACPDGDGVVGVRFELELVEVSGAVTFYADFHQAGARVARWKWDLQEKPKKPRPTFVLRPGLKGHYFRPLSIGDVRTADTLEIFAELRSGATVEFRLHRLAWVD